MAILFAAAIRAGLIGGHAQARQGGNRAVEYTGYLSHGYFICPTQKAIAACLPPSAENKAPVFQIEKNMFKESFGDIL